jgi:ubiquinone/menaquinone biosynthesis C-methylase UbiE
MATRSRSDERLAEVYDTEVYPLWTERFSRMVLRGLNPPTTGDVLDLACAGGHTTLELLKRMGPTGGRIVALEAQSTLTDLARKRAGTLSGKRIYFRTERPQPLPFADDVYELVVSNLGLSEVDDSKAAVEEWVRVTRPGGTLILSCAARGTWREFIDIFREVLIKMERPAILARLESYVASFPVAEELIGWLEAAGLGDLEVEVEEFELLFKSGREFFFAPVVEYGPLRRWKEVVGKKDDVQELFWHAKEAIDTYFDGHHPFAVSAIAVCIRGVKAAAAD